jgi:glutamine synthetase
MSIHVPDFESFAHAHPDTQFVDVLLPDLLSTPRGKRLKMDALPAVYAGAFRLPGSIFAMDALGNTIEATGLGFDDGDADRSCIPVQDSLVCAPWMAALVLAGVHRGITQRIEPGEPVSGNPYRDCTSTPLPTNWYESALAFERSSFVGEYLGPEFQQLFATTRRAELEAFDKQVTPLEYDWYLMAG